MSAPSLELDLLPGAQWLLEAHDQALPQRDDLCGAFCGALALHAARIEPQPGEPIDQDAVALAAGSVVSAVPDARHLPRGERGRRDYRLTPPLTEHADASGTTAAGLVHAIELLSGGALAAIPLAGPWSAPALAAMFEFLRARERPVTLIANVATRHFWGGDATPAQMLAHLLDGTELGPPADWDVGHFVCVIGRVRGPRGTLYGVADTYPSLGRKGLHVQPAGLLVRALERPQMAAGGLLVVASSEDCSAVRGRAGELGLDEHAWDNGTILPEMLA